jgi:uncharacterized protein (TIGR00251 family)
LPNTAIHLTAPRHLEVYGIETVGNNSTRLSIKVVPGSSKNCIAGWLGETLRIRVAAPAERGRANAAVEKIITQVLGLSKGAVRMVSGKTSPRKVVEVDGLSKSEIQQRIEKNAA